MKSASHLLIFIILICLAYWVIIPAQAEGESHVALVVQFDDSNIVTKCVSFSGDQITGYDVLERSGLGLSAEFGSMGAAICKIGNTGCPEDNCWCQFTPTYWSYWHLVDNNWSYSQLGASLNHVQNGAVEGWRWGKADPPSVNYSFEQICQLATATSTASDTPAPTATTEPPTVTPTLHNEENGEENSTPFTIYFDTSSGSSTPSPTWTLAPISAISGNTAIPTNDTVEIQGSTPTIDIVNGETPSVTPTDKVKSADKKATRQAKKTEASYQKTMESLPSPSVQPSPTETPQNSISDNQGIYKFLVVLVLLLIIASAGTFVLMKRG